MKRAQTQIVEREPAYRRIGANRPLKPWSLIALAALVTLIAAPVTWAQSVEVPISIQEKPETPESIQRALDGMEPEVDGWDGEVWNQALKAPMATLRDSVFLGEAIQQEALEALILPAARGLWLESASEDWLQGEGPWWFHSLRAEPGKSLDLAMADGFAILRKEMGGPVTRFEWHVETLEIKAADRIETELHMILLREDSSQSVVLHGFWRANWVKNEEGIVHLSNLRELERETSALKGVSGETRLAGFLDRSSSLFGGGVYQSQLKPGIDHWRERLHTKLGIGLLGHHGLAVGDVNGDGLEDLYVCEPGGLPNRLFLRQADGRSKEAAKDFGLDLLDFTSSALIVDLDNDGDRDLMVATASGVYGFSNEGTAGFQKRFEHLGTDLTSLAAADVDGDGDLDVYACRYSSPYVSSGLPFPYHDAENGAANWLLLNGGEWQFVESADRLGLEEGRFRFSFAASFEDFDNDGDQDLYVGNDFGRNALYRNEGGHFVAMAAELGVEDLAAGMGITWADWNRDGFMDLYVSNMGSNAGQRVTRSNSFLPNAAEQTKLEYLGHARGSSLYVSEESQAFRDKTVGSGARRTGWAWGGLAMDLDCDGHGDLVVPNGFVTGESTNDL
ncbi:MAG: VCBS repeat-containing protein [Planctomycetota bacterium]|nr:VCBS repeat-containing protein [Planctomycetota bacterium]